MKLSTHSSLKSPRRDRRGRRSKQLLDDLKGRRGYWKFIEAAPDGTL
jgi:hypothetical protein